MRDAPAPVNAAPAVTLPELAAALDELTVALVFLEPASRRLRSMNRRAQQLAVRWGGLEPLERSLARQVRGDSIMARSLDGLAVPRETCVVEAPGGAEDVAITAIPVREGAAVVGTLLTVEDASVEMRRARSDAEFVENAAHQLRNPITAIATSAAALLAGAADDETERGRFIAHIARESERMTMLVEALLALAALERGVSRPVVELVRLRTLVEDVLAVTPAGPIAVEASIPDHVAIVGDRELAAQAVGNVLANAVEHARATVRIRSALQGATVVLDVADDGPGIPEDARERVFDRFFRAADRVRTGSGLGLAIARSAAAATRGSLELLSTSGEGTTFRFTFPGARAL